MIRGHIWQDFEFSLYSSLCTGIVVNGQGILNPVETGSSQSHSTCTKVSSVWMHWNYNYFVDGPSGTFSLYYEEQIIGFNNTSNSTLEVRAKRIGQNGVLTLESPVPAPINGRVEVISSNSTLSIHGLQYNDSAYQFSSSVKVDINAGGSVSSNTYHLKLGFSITVNGMSF